MRIAFTGHRPEMLPFDQESDAYSKLEQMVWSEIYQRMEIGYDTFYCGAARGTDIMCGEIVLAEKETMHPHVKLICAIPFKEQAQSWSVTWRMRYRDLLRGADKIIQTSESYHRGCYHVRNRYMVDNADTLIAIYNGASNGGTAYTVKYAQECGKEIVIFNPEDLTRRVINPSEDYTS